MQAFKNKKRPYDHRERNGWRATRRKLIRKPSKSGKAIEQIIASGLYSLKLAPIGVLKVCRLLKDNDQKYNSLYRDLYPAYYRFMTLAGAEPTNIQDDEYAPGKMLQEISAFFDTDVVQIDIFTSEATDEPVPHKFILRKVLEVPEYYSIFFYQPLAGMLWKRRTRKYYHLLHKIFRSLSKMYVPFWSYIQDYPIEWLIEREDEEGEDLRENQRMICEYESGAARESEKRIFRYDPISQSDIDEIYESLDLDHPISKMAIDVFRLLQTGKNVNQYTDVFDEEFYGLRFDCQFQIYYKNDWLFEMHEEFVNNDANEAIQCPTAIVTLSPEMAAFPHLDDPFPLQLYQFFYTYGDIEQQLQKYFETT